MDVVSQESCPKGKKKEEGVRARASLGGHCGETKPHREEENSMENQVTARLDVPGVSDTATRAETAKTTSGGRQGWASLEEDCRWSYCKLYSCTSLF